MKPFGLLSTPGRRSLANSESNKGFALPCAPAEMTDTKGREHFALTNKVKQVQQDYFAVANGRLRNKGHICFYIYICCPLKGKPLPYLSLQAAVLIAKKKKKKGRGLAYFSVLKIDFCTYVTPVVKGKNDSSDKTGKRRTGIKTREVEVSYSVESDILCSSFLGTAAHIHVLQ